jgi:methyl-accepting chemotaxis protein-1 (serine sensor receptor)
MTKITTDGVGNRIRPFFSFRQKKIGFRLGLLVCLMALMLSIFCGAGLYLLSESEKNLTHLFEKRMLPVERVSWIQKETIKVRMMLLRAMAHAAEGADIKPELVAVREKIVAINKVWAQAKEDVTSEKEKELYSGYLDARQTLGAEGVFPLLAALEANDADEASMIESVTGDSYESVETAINEVVSNMQASARLEIEKTIEKNLLVRNTSFVLILSGLFLVIIFSVYIIRSVTQPLKRAVSLADRVASGDLTDNISSNSKDEIAQLLNALGGMSSRLRKMVSEVHNRIAAIKTESNAVAINNSGLAQVTHQQTVSLGQTSKTMGNLMKTNSSTTESSIEAARLAKLARTDTEKGDGVVQKTSLAMNEINISSGKIAEIISTINSIAFQTNLLALNASVEAARAGEQGRGFAVVAGEVRTLAQNSAEAAKEIKLLIDNSVAGIKLGTELVGQTGEMFADVRQRINSVTDIVDTINHAGEHQTAVIEEINAAVSEMNDECESNISVAEKSATSSSSVAAQLNSLIPFLYPYLKAISIACASGQPIQNCY